MHQFKRNFQTDFTATQSSTQNLVSVHKHPKASLLQRNKDYGLLKLHPPWSHHPLRRPMTRRRKKNIILFVAKIKTLLTFLPLKKFIDRTDANPPMMSLTTTRYETIIPITSFRTPSLILRQKTSRWTCGSGLSEGLKFCSHAWWSQICVLVLQLAIQSDATPLSVIGQQRQQRVDLLQGCSGGHGVPEGWTNTQSANECFPTLLTAAPCLTHLA